MSEKYRVKQIGDNFYPQVREYFFWWNIYEESHGRFHVIRYQCLAHAYGYLNNITNRNKVIIHEYPATSGVIVE